MNPGAADADLTGIAFKLDRWGRPVPKAPHEVGLISKNSAQADRLLDTAMDAGHIELER